MRNKEASFVVDETRGTVLMYVTEFDRWGRTKRRTQHTLRRRQFEAALRTADMVVPWQKVER